MFLVPSLACGLIYDNPKGDVTMYRRVLGEVLDGHGQGLHHQHGCLDRMSTATEVLWCITKNGTYRLMVLTNGERVELYSPCLGRAWGRMLDMHTTVRLPCHDLQLQERRSAICTSSQSTYFRRISSSTQRLAASYRFATLG